MAISEGGRENGQYGRQPYTHDAVLRLTGLRLSILQCLIKMRPIPPLRRSNSSLYRRFFPVEHLVSVLLILFLKNVPFLAILECLRCFSQAPVVHLWFDHR